MSRKLFNEAALAAWKEIDRENWKVIALELIHVFLEIAPGQMTQLCNYWNAKDIEGVKQVAHSLKSSCGNVGAEEAHDLLSAIEKAAMIQDKKSLEQLMLKFPPVFYGSVNLINTFVKANQAA